MRKLLVVLTMFPTLAYAGNWKLIVDSTDGSRLLVDTETVKSEKYQKPGGTGTKIYGTMSMVSDGEETLFTAVIDSDDCLGPQRGGTLGIIYQDGYVKKYFWSMSGNKMYDAEGQWLCGYLEGTLEKMKKEKTKSKTL